MADGTVLFAVRENSGDGGAGADQLRRIQKELEASGYEVRWASTSDGARAVLRTEAGLAAAVVDWGLPGAGEEDGKDGGAGDGEPGGAGVLRQVGRRFQNLPVFLITAGEDLDHLPLWVAETVVGYIWPLEDTAPFIAGRIARAARGYQEELLPPFFKALRAFDDTHEYSWHTPAHSGGVAFLKSPVGR
ncbi:arginine decarboxylase, partial [Streptomyces sp. AA8]